MISGTMKIMPKLDLLKIATQSPDEVVALLQTTENGLSSTRAAELMAEYGPNCLTAQSKHWWQVLLRQIKSPFIYVLLFAAVLALVLGEFLDAGMIVTFVVINSLLGFFQEYRSEQALKLLQKYTVNHTHVLRDGQEKLIDSTELVPGDVILLAPGDIVPADARVFSSHNLMVNESVLTGESVPVEKSCEATEKIPKQVIEARCLLFSATSVLRGSAKAVILATGKHSYVGQIAKLTVESAHQSSFEKGMSRFSTFVLKLVVVTLAFLMVANVFVKSETADVIELIIFSIALATAVIPEALPLVITFSLSRGAVRLAKHKVVVKRLSAIEDLGGIEVLCTDKTGTITRNILTVSGLFAQGGPRNDEQVFTVAALGIPAQMQHPDPFDSAITEAVKEQSISLPGMKQLAELPFDPQRRRNSVLLEDLHSNRKTLVVRGAVEAVLPHCKNVHASELKRIQEWVQQQGREGKRVIALAERPYQHHNLDKYTTEIEEKQLDFVGCLAFSDPLKSTATSAIAKAKELGVQVKILTGDSPEVAGAIAQEVGLISSLDQVMTGAALEEMTPAAQHAAVLKHHVFARVSPQQKFTIIQLLQEKHEVGYLGEGINDAPALKAANVSLAVQGASDIAKDTADVILLNSSLRVIVDGIQEGREVFANTIKYVRLTMASNFGNFFAVAVASFIVNYLPMLPVQILLVNLLTDFPLIAVATDSVDPIDTRKPEKYDIKDFALICTFLGIVSSLFDFLFFGFFSRISAPVLQTNWFIGSVLCELILFFSLRSRLPFFKAKFPSLFVFILTVLACVSAVILPYTSFGQAVFHFEAPTQAYLLLTLSLVFAYFVTTELVKLLYYRVFERKQEELEV